MGKGRVTINTIAEKLQVSAVTVSRALSNQPGVSDELREKIVRTAQELGYKRVRGIEGLNILLLIRRRFTGDQSNFSQMVNWLEHYIKDAGAGFTMEFIEKEKQDELVEPYNLKRGKFNAVILLGRFEAKYAEFLQKRIQNMVMVNGYLDDVLCDFVSYNRRRTGYQGGMYLGACGHQKIGIVGVEGFNGSERLAGFIQAQAKQGLEVVDKWVIPNREEMPGRIGELIRENDLPTAFLCNTDHTALHLIKLLHGYGLSVPKDVSVIGCGNTDVSGVAIPALTTFDINIQHTCEIAVDVLLRRLKHPEMPYITTFVDTVLVERESVRNLATKETVRK